jgi:hypothetical protein
VLLAARSHQPSPANWASGQTGLLVLPDDPTALAEGISALVRDLDGPRPSGGSDVD